MKKILKYGLPTSGSPINGTVSMKSQTLVLTEGATILSAVSQGNAPFLYFLADTKAKPEERKIEVFGLGDEVPDDANLRFVGTVFTQRDAFAWHIFEKRIPLGGSSIISDAVAAGYKISF